MIFRVRLTALDSTLSREENNSWQNKEHQDHLATYWTWYNHNWAQQPNSEWMQATIAQPSCSTRNKQQLQQQGNVANCIQNSHFQTPIAHYEGSPWRSIMKVQCEALGRGIAMVKMYLLDHYEKGAMRHWWILHQQNFVQFFCATDKVKFCDMWDSQMMLFTYMLYPESFYHSNINLWHLLVCKVVSISWVLGFRVKIGVHWKDKTVLISQVLIVLNLLEVWLCFEKARWFVKPVFDLKLLGWI